MFRFFLATLIDLWQRLDERYVLGEDDTLVGMAFAARHKAPLDIKPLDVKVSRAHIIFTLKLEGTSTSSSG